MLVETATSYLQAITSDDDGKTWSEPIELNLEVKEEWMRFIGTGSGHGIQLEHGEHKGRLVFPIYYSNEIRLMPNTIIYSDDNGQIWKRSDSPNDNRDLTFKFDSAEDLGKQYNKYELTESQTVELSDGSVQFYMRNHFGNGHLARANSHDGGQTWEDFEFLDDLINPVCQFSVIKYPSKERDIIVFSGPFSKDKRENGVLMISKDGGETFEHMVTLGKGSFVYSCLTVVEDGEIGVLYET